MMELVHFPIWIVVFWWMLVILAIVCAWMAGWHKGRASVHREWAEHYDKLLKRVNKFTQEK